MLSVIDGVNGGVVGSNETDDVLVGDATDNTFFVGMGIDFVDGGAGFDVLNVDGDLIEWTFTEQNDGSVLATHATWGANTLTNVEAIFFARSGETFSLVDSIAGTAGLPAQRIDNDNVLNGTNGDDVLFATANLSGLYGGVGDDIYDADPNGFSQINYDGARSEFTIVENADGSITIFHPIWGTDTASNIDALIFTGLEPGVDGNAVGEFEFLAVDDIVFGAHT